MNLKAVIFDLDGTVLPLNQEEFEKTYFKSLTDKFGTLGYDRESFLKAMKIGVNAMFNNDGIEVNERVFWKTFSGILGDKILTEEENFQRFYENEFQNIATICKPTPKAKWAVDEIKAMGLRVILATNPAFPSIATESRIRWAGLEPSDFEFFTTYHESHFCKPTMGYYNEVLERAGLKAEECLMVGNDVDDDMKSEKVGMNVFLHTDCLVNRKNLPFQHYPQGGFKELVEYVKKNI